ncbi:ammonium transporter [Streptococcus macacae]|uniref:Ammonium transporter n=1 Tax=Streptococcus macacae NCTC 11558 TaxID=764298 RepID=G5JYE4_9STRE|nr:ammonium transporter [Streptococcus macacae]EHJ51653.1 ammonium transporter [Streptococcus macacae NCTC 11558]SUN78057.1 ammonium transporter [Streptococcus macacae NCTC 11558]
MDVGNTAFILISAAMVFFMTPGLAFFYGGLGRRKNVISTMMMSVTPIAIAIIMWVVIGYSLSFSGQGKFFGNLNHLFLNGVSETTSHLGNKISDMTFSSFQMMFSIITLAIIIGAVVGRIRFTPLLIFMPLWLLLVYYPLAHMVWGGGLLAKLGALDFAGGDVVHISSGVTGLILAVVVGKRKDYGRIDYRPHNVPFVLLGTAILAFGWLGFNAGSALSADSSATHAFMTTMLSAASGMLSWILIEKKLHAKPSLVGSSTGLVAGLVAITPGAGYVSIASSLLIGFLVSPVCYFAISVLKQKLDYDDALDAFGCHGVGGIFGGLATSVFTTPGLTSESGNFGLLYGSTHLLTAILIGILLTIIWTGVSSFIIIKAISYFMPLRVSQKEEALGLDDSEHKETAYPTFMGMDS